MLPIKSLLRFRCVSKLWRCSISDPKFTLSAQSRRRRLVIASPVSLHSIAIDDDDNQGLGSSAAKLHYPWNNDSLHTEPRVLGACDGLLLISFLENVYLWNPSTIEYKKLFTYKISVSNCAINGLCYDSSTNDYKVVIGGGGIHYRSVIVSSLKSQCRKKVLLPEKYVPLRNSGPLVNGYLHWIMARTTETVDAIIYFDPAKDKFGEVPIPPPNNRDEHPIIGLGELDGCLAMTRQENDFDFKVLAMKTYGVEETWTTLFKFSTFGKMKHPYYKLEPLCITKDGEVLMLIAGEEIVAYNPKEGSHRSVMISRKDYSITTVFTYVESLINLARGF